MGDPFESDKQEILGHADFRRLAEQMGADTEDKRQELAQRLAESFRSGQGIAAEEDSEESPSEEVHSAPRTIHEFVTHRAHQVTGRKKHKKKRKGARHGWQFPGRSHRPNPGPPAAAASSPARKSADNSMRLRGAPKASGEPSGVTWDQAAGRPEAAVPLPRLPGALKFHPNFPEPIQFDHDARQLRYRGFMTTNSYRYLLSLSSDLDYLRALNDLNAATVNAMATPAEQAGASRWPWWIALALVAALAALIWLWRR